MTDEVLLLEELYIQSKTVEGVGLPQQFGGLTPVSPNAFCSIRHRKGMTALEKLLVRRL